MIKISNEVFSAKTVRKQILAEIKNGIFANCERLPRETILSEKLGISRTQLRDVLAALEQEGFITRRLAGVDYKDAWRLEHKNNYRQLSLFDDFHIQAG